MGTYSMPVTFEAPDDATAKRLATQLAEEIDARFAYDDRGYNWRVRPDLLTKEGRA